MISGPKVTVYKRAILRRMELQEEGTPEELIKKYNLSPEDEKLVLDAVYAELNASEDI